MVDYKAKILVADDDPHGLSYLAMELRRGGYEVVTAKDGWSALDAINQHHFDIVIADLKLSDHDGLEILRQAKQQTEFTEVILITGRGSEDDAIQALREGAYDYLRKPVDRIELLHKAVRALERVQNRKAQAERQQELERLVKLRTAELEASRAKYEDIIANMIDGFYQIDLREVIVECNPAFAWIHGYTRDQLIGKKIRETLYQSPPERDRFLQEIERNGQVNGWIVHSKHKDGREIIVEVSSHEIVDESGRVVGIEGIARDITKRRRLEEEKLLQAAEYYNLFENLSEGVYRVDESDNIVICNNHLAQIFGYQDKDELIGKNVKELYFDPAERDVFIAVLRVNGLVTNHIERLRRKDGNAIIVSVNASYLAYDPAKCNWIEGSVREVTAEETYKEICQLSHRMSADAIYVISLDKRFRYVNEAGSRLLGYEEKEILGKEFTVVVHPEDEPTVTAQLMKKMKNQEYESHYRFRCIKRDDTEIWVEVDSKFCTYLGEPGVIVFARDVSLRIEEELKKDKRREELEKLVQERTDVLEKERNRFNAILDGLVEPVIIISEDYVVKYQNKQSREVFGDGLNKKCYKLFKCGSFRKQDCKLHRLFQQTEGELYYERTYKNGKTYRYGARRFRDLDGSDSLLEIGMDITELREKELELILTSKLATLGELAAGMAHELHQPLNHIGICVPLIRRELSSCNAAMVVQVNNRLDVINRQLDRAKKIVDRVRGFSRYGPADDRPQLTDVNKVVENAMTFFGEQFRAHGIDVTYQLEMDVPPILAAADRLEQVVINLITNAKEAIEAKWKGTPSPLENPQIVLKTYQDARKGIAGIIVADNGNGIPKRLRRRIFDPFFTTKKEGLSQGLGLAISSDLVKEQGGKIKVNSKDGEGAQFCIEFPMHTQGEDRNETSDNIDC